MVETILLDACCALNLYATGRIEAIFGQLPHRFCIGSRARREAQWLRIPDEEDRELVDLQPLIEIQLLVEESLRGSEEGVLFVEFGALLADGEAEAIALAVSRGFILATDDLKARRIVAARYGAVGLTSTLELLREWQVTASLDGDVLADALRRIDDRATYRPRRADPLWRWGADLLGEQ